MKTGDDATSRPRILLLNQVAGPLFRELAEDLAKKWGAARLVTGRAPEAARVTTPQLSIGVGPEYDRRSNLRRLFSWLKYAAFAASEVWRSDRRTPLLIVSNPPFLPLVGWLAWRLRGQRYVILIYDFYPGVLENLGKIRRGGAVARCWRWFNRLTWRSAAMLITIGDEMAANIRRDLPRGSRSPLVHVIPNWVDTTFVRPRAKEKNDFAAAHGQQGRVTVLYAGNLGHSHNLDPLLDAAVRLQGEKDCAFLIVGDGARRPAMVNRVESENLTNVTLLPFQPENVLPDLLATGEVAVVTFARGAEGFIVPSKTFYSLAAGSALLVLAHFPNEVSQLVAEFECGVTVAPSDTAGIAAALRRFVREPEYLAACRERARRAAVEHFDRSNTARYAGLLRPLIEETAA